MIPICQIIRKSINASPAPNANLIPLLSLQMLWVSELEDSLFFAPEKLILSVRFWKMGIIDLPGAVTSGAKRPPDR